MAAGHKAPLGVFLALVAACSFILVSDLRGSAVIGGAGASEQPAAARAGGSTVQPTPRAVDGASGDGAGARRPRVATAAGRAAGPRSAPSTPSIGVAVTASRRSGAEPVSLRASGLAGAGGLAAPGAGIGVSSTHTPDGAAQAPGGPKPDSVPTLGFVDLWSLPTLPATPTDDVAAGEEGEQPGEPGEADPAAGETATPEEPAADEPGDRSQSGGSAAEEPTDAP